MQDYRTTMKPRASARRPPPIQVNTTASGVRAPVQPDAEEDEYYRPAVMPRSALRYTTANGDEIIQQGNRRLHIHYGQPPRQARRVHWLLFVGVGMLGALLLWAGLGAISSWWANHQFDAQYGNPRTWQVDEVVGHSDSSMHPSHFIFLNLSAHVIVIELPGGDVSHARIYSGPQLFGDNAANLPVTGEFKDVNGDGRVDMIVYVGDQQFVYLNDGTEFKPKQ